MSAHYRYLLQILRTSLWLLPFGGIIVAMLSAYLMLRLDAAGLAPFLEKHGLYELGPEGARLILSTIAGSMMTVASLVFSLTLMTLTLASQQLGPRLVQTFMADGLNQSVLAFFVSIFTYALLVLGAIDAGDKPYIPHGSVLFGIFVTLCGILLLVVYIHNAANSIQADTIISRNGAVLIEIVQNMQRADSAQSRPEHEPTLIGQKTSLYSDMTGYVQVIDMAEIVDAARRHNVVVELRCRPGWFLMEGSVIAVVWGRDEARDLRDVIFESVALGPKRTATQDVEFAMRSLVEIALRALSPGINDPFTAVACLDYLGAAVAASMRRRILPRVLVDEKGDPRVLADRPTIKVLMSTAFDDIRQNAEGHVTVLSRMAEVLTMLADHIGTAEHAHLLRRQGEALRRITGRSVHEPFDRAEIENRLIQLERALGRHEAGAPPLAGR
ncbi:MAG: DUF2254 domain-containing protein [Geminicoccaceae bacterium]|nr:DUF2254 domain-containing protein [Geminicoccaceae bacterium]